MTDLVERLREQARYEAMANNSIKYPPGQQRAEDSQSWKDADQVERLREALRAIAGFGSINLAGEYEHGLRDIIRSMTDCARAALSQPKATTET